MKIQTFEDLDSGDDDSFQDKARFRKLWQSCKHIPKTVPLVVRRAMRRNSTTGCKAYADHNTATNERTFSREIDSVRKPVKKNAR